MKANFVEENILEHAVFPNAFSTHIFQFFLTQFKGSGIQFRK